MGDAHKIFLFGIDRAGKTALGETIKKGQVVKDTKPTLAFNIGNMVMDDISFQIWDAPGQPAFRKMWKNGFQKAKILLFLCDTADKDRYIESKKEFDNVLRDMETRGIPLVFCYHKMDLEDAKKNLNDAKAVYKLPFITDRKVIVLETSIFQPESIKKLQDTLQEVIIGGRW